MVAKKRHIKKLPVINTCILYYFLCGMDPMLLFTETRINIGDGTDLDLDDFGEHSCDSNLSDALDAGQENSLFNTENIDTLSQKQYPLMDRFLSDILVFMRLHQEQVSAAQGVAANKRDYHRQYQHQD